MPTAVAQEVFPEDLTSHAGMTAAIDSGSEGHSEESEVVLPFNVASDGETPCPRPPPCVPQKTQCEFPSKGGDLLLPKSGMKGRENESLRFKIIVVGESGLGKSTAIDCLTAKLRKQHAHASEGSQGLSSGANDPQGQIQKTVKITENDEFELLTEERERTFLRIVDTPGYGDNVDCSADMGEICNYIEKQWKKFDVAPKGVRAVEHDSLVTCCLYFIAPHRLKEIDINFLQKVSAMVPCVPVIAKSDTMTVEEAAAFREEVAKRLLDTEGINLYDWRYGTDKAEDESVSSYRRRYEHENGGRGRKLPPFTLVADTSHSVRHYPWGDCQLENEEHSDFALLRKLLLQEHLFEMAKRSEEAYNRWVEAKQGDAKQPSTKLSWRHSAVSWISRRWQDQPTVKLAVLAVFVLVAVLAVFVLRQEVNSCSVELGEQRNVSVSLSRSLEAERADLDRKKKEAADLKSKKNTTEENAFSFVLLEVAELKDQLEKEKKEAADLKSKEQQLRKDYESKKNDAFDLRKDNESMKKKVAELKDQLKKEKKESAELKSKEQQLREDYESKKNCALL